MVDSTVTNPLLDISETQSESAWSTDVLTSDTERLTEVDNDDIASVARSDDASSVARSDDINRSEVDDSIQADQGVADRRLSNPSFQYVNNLDFNYVEYRRPDGGQEQMQLKNVNISKQKEVRSNSNGNPSAIPSNPMVFNEFNRSSGANVEQNITINSQSMTERRSSDGISQLALSENLQGRTSSNRFVPW